MVGSTIRILHVKSTRYVNNLWRQKGHQRSNKYLVRCDAWWWLTIRHCVVLKYAWWSNDQNKFKKSVGLRAYSSLQPWSDGPDNQFFFFDFLIQALILNHVHSSKFLLKGTGSLPPHYCGKFLLWRDLSRNMISFNWKYCADETSRLQATAFSPISPSRHWIGMGIAHLCILSRD